MSTEKLPPAATATTDYDNGEFLFITATDSGNVSVLATGAGATNEISFTLTGNRSLRARDIKKWKTVAYEIKMYFETLEMMRTNIKEWALHNAIVESATIHHRCLVDFLLSGRSGRKKNHETDVAIGDLFDDWKSNAQYSRLKKLIVTLDKEYGSNIEGNPRWEFNTLMAHVTEYRSRGHDYGPAFDKMRGPIVDCVRELETLTGVKLSQKEAVGSG
jgi:hypothetical protein